MKKDIAEKWVADLRTPGLKQTKGVLFDGKGYCCLGRLCVVLGKQFEVVPSVFDETSEVIPPRFFLEGENVIPPESVVNQAGLKTPIGEIYDEKIRIGGKSHDALTEANDDGVSFLEIADWIENNWEKL